MNSKVLKLVKNDLIESNAEIANGLYENKDISYKEKQDMISFFTRDIKSCKNIDELFCILDQHGFDQEDGIDLVLNTLSSIIEKLIKNKRFGE